LLVTLGFDRPCPQAKADLEAGKDPTKKEDAPKEEAPKEEAKATGKMSMAERMAALQKNNQHEPPKGPAGGGALPGLDPTTCGLQPSPARALCVAATNILELTRSRPTLAGRGKIKKKEPQPTLGGRLRSGIGEVGARPRLDR
jgi:hypothetical protein